MQKLETVWRRFARPALLLWLCAILLAAFWFVRGAPDHDDAIRVYLAVFPVTVFLAGGEAMAKARKARRALRPGAIALGALARGALLSAVLTLLMVGLLTVRCGPAWGLASPA